MSASTHASGVVLCVIDQLGSEGLAALPRASAALERFESIKLARAPGFDEGAAHYAIGTGLHRPQISAALDKLLESGSLRCAPALEAVFAEAEYRRGTVVDFMTEIEQPRCTVHLVAHVSSDPKENRHLHELVEALQANDFPFVVHAIVGDSRAATSAPQKAAQSALEQLEHRFGQVGSFATVMGCSWALGAELDWQRALIAFEAIVHGQELGSARTIYQALESAYDAEHGDASIQPTRIGEYRGVYGGLRAELPAEAPVWAWHGEDVGIVWVNRGEDATPLVSLLLGRDLPPHAAQNIAHGSRARFAFAEQHLASLVSLGGFDIPSLFDSAASSASLLESLAYRGKKCRAVFDPARRKAVSWSLEGDREAAVGALVEESVDAAAALALALEGVTTGEFDFQLVAVSGLVPDAIDVAVESLARAVVERGGALIVVASDTMRLAAEGSSASASPPAEHRDVFRLAHELLGVAIQDAAAASRPARRRR